MIRFDIPGVPQGKGRARAGKVAGKARLFTPEKTVAYEGLIALCARQAMAGRPPITGPVDVTVRCVFPVPASWSKRRRAEALGGLIRPTGKPDADNVAKAVGDGCNGVVWADDSAITDLTVTKRYGDRPEVVVIVEPADVQPATDVSRAFHGPQRAERGQGAGLVLAAGSGASAALPGFDAVMESF